MTHKGRDRHGIDLLEQAATELREALAPQLGGDARYQALLAASAVATAARAARAAPHLDRTVDVLAGVDVAAIRAGAHDTDVTLHRHLRAQAALCAWVADPRSLTAAEAADYLPEDLHDT